MKAGRELDALVAERVMGWKTFAGEPGYGRPPSKPISLVLDPIPPYSTDISAAWLVVERMEEGLWALTLVRGRDSDGSISGGWQAIFADPEASFDAVEHTVPMALCMAALAALGALS